MSSLNQGDKGSETSQNKLATPTQPKKPRPSLKPPNSARSATRKRQSVKFADTADIRLIYQRAANHSPSSPSPAKHVEEHEDMWFEMDSASKDDDDDFVPQKSVEMSVDPSSTSRNARPSAPLSKAPTLSQVADMYDTSMYTQDIRGLSAGNTGEELGMDDDDDDDDVKNDDEEFCGSISMTTDDSAMSVGNDSQYVTTVIPTAPSLGKVAQFYDDDSSSDSSVTDQSRDGTNKDGNQESTMMELTTAVTTGPRKSALKNGKKRASSSGNMEEEDMELTESAVFRNYKSPSVPKRRTTPGSSGKKRKMPSIHFTESDSSEDRMEMTDVVRSGTSANAASSTSAVKNTVDLASKSHIEGSTMEVTDLTILPVVTENDSAAEQPQQEEPSNSDVDDDEMEVDGDSGEKQLTGDDGLDDLDLSNEPTILSASAWSLGMQAQQNAAKLAPPPATATAESEPSPVSAPPPVTTQPKSILRKSEVSKTPYAQQQQQQQKPQHSMMMSAIKPKNDDILFDEVDVPHGTADSITGNFTTLISKQLLAHQSSSLVTCDQLMKIASINPVPSNIIRGNKAVISCLSALFPPPQPDTPGRPSPNDSELKVHEKNQALIGESIQKEYLKLKELIAKNRHDLEIKRMELTAMVPELADSLKQISPNGAPANDEVVADVKLKLGAMQEQAIQNTLSQIPSKLIAPILSRSLTTQQERVKLMRECLQQLRQHIDDQRLKKTEFEAENHRLQSFLKEADSQPTAKRRKLVSHLMDVARDSFDESGRQEPEPLCCDAGVQTLPPLLIGSPVIPNTPESSKNDDDSIYGKLMEVCRAEDGWSDTKSNECRSVFLIYKGGILTLSINFSNNGAHAALGALAGNCPKWAHSWLSAMVSSTNTMFERATSDVLSIVKRLADELQHYTNMRNEIDQASLSFPLSVEVHSPSSRVSQIQSWVMPYPSVTVIFASTDCRVSLVLTHRNAAWSIADLQVFWGRPGSSKEALARVLSKSLSLLDVCKTVGRAVLASGKNERTKGSMKRRG